MVGVCGGLTFCGYCMWLGFRCGFLGLVDLVGCALLCWCLGGLLCFVVCLGCWWLIVCTRFYFVALR